MMKKAILFSIVLVTMYIVQSCTKTTGNAAESILSENTVNMRATFTSGKSQSELKDSYGKLSKDKQIALWLDKVNQISTQKLPTQHLLLLASLKSELQKTNLTFSLSNDKIRNIALDLARITPGDDFIDMFDSMNDYTYVGKFHGTDVCSSCITDIENEGVVPVNNPSSPNARVPVCNCAWTCGHPFGPGGSSNCRQTSSGCGFLWMSGCMHEY